MYDEIKRFFDLLLAGVLLLVLSPLLIPISIVLRLTGEGYVWYFQERVGFKNQKFNIWKFATMLKDSPNMAGGLITTKKDPRLTPMGPFLRRTKINELPQLINIVRGDMSIVGPRPVMQKSFDQYPPDVQAVIYDVRPGLTGIGSVIFRDEEELLTRVKESGGDTWAFYKETLYPFKGKLEQWYQRNRSFWTDLKIIVLTALAIVQPNNSLANRWFSDLPKRNF
jgi:lipopolysaccharide/colanic/teichoic acid biosynthesis glycosyltransferase